MNAPQKMEFFFSINIEVDVFRSNSMKLDVCSYELSFCNPDYLKRMGSKVSDTDLRVFTELSNPQKINANRPSSQQVQPDIPSEDDSDERASSVDSEDDNGSNSHASVSSSASSVENENASYVSSHHSLPRSTCSESFVAENRTHISSVTDVRSHASTTQPTFEQLMNKHNPSTASLPAYTGSKTFGDRELLDKQAILLDMEKLKLQGIQLSKNWTLDDRLDDMRFEMRRHTLHLEEMNNINIMRDGMRLMCTGVEMISGKIGILDIDGWATEVCSDMGRYDTALGRIYRKYWKRSTSTSPEMEIVMGLVGSIGMYHFKRKISTHIFPTAPSMRTESAEQFQNRARPNFQHAPSEISDDDEFPPP